MNAFVCLRRMGIALLFVPLALAGDPASIVAVFDIESKGVGLSPEQLDRMTDYLSSELAATGAFRVVPRAQIEERLRQEQKSTHRDCYSQACQIELGRDLAAEKTVSAQIMKLGSRCVVTVTVYDLRQAITAKAATQKGACDEDGIIESVDKVVATLSGKAATGPAEASQPTAPAVESPPKRYLSLAKEEYFLDEKVQVNWANTPPGNKEDWVAVAPANEPDDSRGNYTYLQGARSGAFQPKGLAAGNYEARLYLDWPRGKFNVVDRLRFRVLESTAPIRLKHLGVSSGILKAGSEAIIAWFDTPGNQSDWITVVEAGESDQTYGKWTYLGGKKEGQFSVPELKPGKYEARLYLDWPRGSYKVIERLRFEVR